MRILDIFHDLLNPFVSAALARQYVMMHTNNFNLSYIDQNSFHFEQQWAIIHPRHASPRTDLRHQTNACSKLNAVTMRHGAPALAQQNWNCLKLMNEYEKWHQSVCKKK